MAEWRNRESASCIPPIYRLYIRSASSKPLALAAEHCCVQITNRSSRRTLCSRQCSVWSHSLHTGNGYNGHTTATLPLALGLGLRPRLLPTPPVQPSWNLSLLDPVISRARAKCSVRQEQLRQAPRMPVNRTMLNGSCTIAPALCAMHASQAANRAAEDKSLRSF